MVRRDVVVVVVKIRDGGFAFRGALQATPTCRSKIIKRALLSLRTRAVLLGHEHIYADMTRSLVPRCEYEFSSNRYCLFLWFGVIVSSQKVSRGSARVLLGLGW